MDWHRSLDSRFRGNDGAEAGTAARDTDFLKTHPMRCAYPNSIILPTCVGLTPSILAALV